MKKYVTSGAALIGMQFAAFAALAHVGLETKSAQVDSKFDAVFHVGHGCAGSPTVRLRIRIPPGVADVEPQLKGGWNLTTETGTLDPTVVSGGQTFKEGVKEVAWSGLLSAHTTTTFTLKARVAADAKPGQKVIFPVVQECEKGVERWTDLNDDDNHPAPYLTIVPKR